MKIQHNGVWLGTFHGAVVKIVTDLLGDGDQPEAVITYDDPVPNEVKGTLSRIDREGDLVWVITPHGHVECINLCDITCFELVD